MSYWGRMRGFGDSGQRFNGLGKGTRIRGFSTRKPRQEEPEIRLVGLLERMEPGRLTRQN